MFNCSFCYISKDIFKSLKSSFYPRQTFSLRINAFATICTIRVPAAEHIQKNLESVLHACLQEESLE